MWKLADAGSFAIFAFGAIFFPSTKIFQPIYLVRASLSNRATISPVLPLQAVLVFSGFSRVLF